MPLWFLAGVVSLNWRAPLRVRAVALHVYAPRYGHVTLVVTRNRHGDEEFLATNARDLDLTSVVRRKWNRWSVETVFRDSKQYSGLEACPCWVDKRGSGIWAASYSRLSSYKYYARRRGRAWWR
jgi:hypothetical protein